MQWRSYHYFYFISCNSYPAFIGLLVFPITGLHYLHLPAASAAAGTTRGVPLPQEAAACQVSAGIVLIAFVALLITMLSIISRTFIPTFTRFVTDLPQLSLSLQNIPFLPDSDFLANEVDSLMKEMTNVSVDALKSSLSMILSIFGKFIDFVIILFVTFYLLKDGEEIKVFLASLFPHKDYARVLNLFNRILRCILFRAGTLCHHGHRSILLLRCAARALCLRFRLRFRYQANSSGARTDRRLRLWNDPDRATQAPGLTLQTLAFYVVLTQINHNFVYPTLIGKSLNLHPIAIILGIIFGGELLNAAGMFLAVPVIVILQDRHRGHLQGPAGSIPAAHERCRCPKPESK